MNYEYNIIIYTLGEVLDTRYFCEELDSLGRDGWKLTVISSCYGTKFVYHFMRPLKDKNYLSLESHCNDLHD